MTSGSTHVNRVEEKTCGCANTLVDLCNSRAGGVWSLLGGERDGWPGLEVARHENGHERKDACRVSPGGLLSFNASSRQPPQGRHGKHGSISSCASFPFPSCCYSAATRPPSFTDPPAAVEVEWWCSCRSMNRTLHKVTANASSLSLVTCQSRR